MTGGATDLLLGVPAAGVRSPAVSAPAVSAVPQKVALVQQVQSGQSTPMELPTSGTMQNGGAAATAGAAGATVGAGMCDEKTVEYLRDLIEERNNIECSEEGSSKKNVLRLLDQGKKLFLLFKGGHFFLEQLSQQLMCVS